MIQVVIRLTDINSILTIEQSQFNGSQTSFTVIKENVKI